MTAVAQLSELKKRYALDLPEVVPGFVKGERLAVAPGAHRIPHHYPGTGESTYDVIETSAGEVDLAVRAAREAFDQGPWPRMPHRERKRALRRITDVLEKHADELAVIQSLEVGLPLGGVRNMHMARTIENFDFFSEVAGTVAGQAFTQTGDYLSVVTREPAGVAAILSPWNAPLVLSSMKLAAGLALGNTCIIKPSEYSPYSLLRFVELLQEADLPPGVIGLVNGRGPVTGQALVGHPGVDVVGFIGGTATGAAIMATAAKTIKKVGLELGGKSANIVLASADLEQAIDGSLLAILTGNGQQCLAGSRILIERPVADQFIEAFTARMRNVVVGDPFAADTEIGPMAFAAHREKVRSYVGIAESEGGRVLCGGKALPDLGDGYFFEPTAVLAASNSSRVCQEEIFGPFASLLVVDDVEQAIGIANDSQFGLVSYVWSRDLSSVMNVAQRIQAGTVWVNTPLARDLRAPFGGYKQSGLGRDGLQASVELMTEEKTMMLPTHDLTLPRMGLTKDPR